MNRRFFEACYYSSVYDSDYHTPLGRFSMVDISRAGIVSVPNKVGVGKTFRRELSEDGSIVRYWHPLWLSRNRARKTAPGGDGVIYTVVYGN